MSIGFYRYVYQFLADTQDLERYERARTFRPTHWLLAAAAQHPPLGLAEGLAGVPRAPTFSYHPYLEDDVMKRNQMNIMEI